MHFFPANFRETIFIRRSSRAVFFLRGGTLRQGRLATLEVCGKVLLFSLLVYLATSYSTNLHTRDYHSGQKQFLSILPDFQENLHCVQNWYQKLVWLDFDVSSPGYVAINGKLSHIPQICILETIILVENYSCQFSQISRKSDIVCKISPKNEFGEILKSHPLAMWQSIES